MDGTARSVVKTLPACVASSAAGPLAPVLTNPGPQKPEGDAAAGQRAAGWRPRQWSGAIILARYWSQPALHSTHSPEGREGEGGGGPSLVAFPLSRQCGSSTRSPPCAPLSRTRPAGRLELPTPLCSSAQPASRFVHVISKLGQIRPQMCNVRHWTALGRLRITVPFAHGPWATIHLLSYDGQRLESCQFHPRPPRCGAITPLRDLQATTLRWSGSLESGAGRPSSGLPPTAETKEV